jgi:hypothetical protein
MDIKEEHRALLKGMGLREEDFQFFDGKYVTYEYDERKGVRLYDPLYRTSYDEYIDVSGWSAWSSEEDRFMSTILKPAREEAKRRESISQPASDGEIAESLQKKFGKFKPDKEDD